MKRTLLAVFLTVTMPIWLIPVAVGFVLFVMVAELYESMSDFSGQIIDWWNR